MGRKLALAGALIIVLIGSGGLGDARAARLDPSFGNGGVLRLPAEDPGQPVVVERQLPDGRTLKVERDRLLAFLPTGEIATDFGDSGVATLRVPSGGHAGFPRVRVDQHGRLVVISTWSPDGVEQGRFGSEDMPTEILAQRFTGAGQADLSFGEENGMVLTDFGLPPAEAGLLPSLWLYGNVVLDAEGGVLISGVRTAGVREVKILHFYRGTEAFLGRLTPDGDIDRSFGTGGAIAMPGFADAGWLAPNETGGAFVTYRRGYERVVARLTQGGLDPAFGEGGLRAFARFGGPISNPLEPIGLDPRGALVFSGELQGDRDRHIQNGFVLKRLLTTGKLDPTFGRNGAAVFRYPRVLTSSVGMDDRGRFVAALALRGRNRTGILMDAPRVGIALARLRVNGEVDRGFGKAGVFRVPLPGRGEVWLESFSISSDAAEIGYERCRDGCQRYVARILLDA